MKTVRRMIAASRRPTAGGRGKTLTLGKAYPRMTIFVHFVAHLIEFQAFPTKCATKSAEKRLLGQALGWIFLGAAIIVMRLCAHAEVIVGPVDSALGCVAAPSGLVGWWRGENNTLDAIGSSHGVLVGNTTFASGYVGNGFVFDGRGDAVSLGTATALELQQFTIEAWVKRTDSGRATQDPGGNGNGGIVVGPLGGFGFAMGDNGQLILTKVGETAVFGTRKVTDTHFHHLAVARDASAVTFYVDGTVDSVTPYDAQFRFDGPLAIGARGGDSAGAFWGTIDEVAIYSRALNATEVSAIYRAATEGKCIPASLPLIYSQPADQTVFESGYVSWEVLAQGSEPLTYEWTFNGAPLAGADRPTLTLTNVQATDAGVYVLRVSNPEGSVLSSPARLTVQPLPPCLTAADGLVGFWRGDGSAVDEVGGNHGTLAGNATFGTGLIRQGFVFDGIGDGVTLADTPSLRSQNFTIEAWIQRADLARATKDPAGFGTGCIFAGGHRAYGLVLGDDGRLILSKIAESAVFSSLVVKDTAFHHVAVTKDGSTVIFYLDGTAEATSYDTTFEFAGPFAIGALASGAIASFWGTIDEVAFYTRSLSAAEIQDTSSRARGGKCAPLLAPFVVVHPEEQTALVGADVTLKILAGGTQPLSYQWSFNGTPIEGANEASLILRNVQLANAGLYSVLISNPQGSVTSSNAVLAVKFLPASLHVGSAVAAAGENVSVPITLLANGNESALSCSLNFLPTSLLLTQISLGKDALGAALLVNTNEAAAGRIGLAVSLPADQVFAPGTQEVAQIMFTAAVLTNAGKTPLSFGDLPIRRQLSDPQARPLEARFISGEVSVSPAEVAGDVAPRPKGDQTVSLTDWVLVGRYVARLDFPTNASELRRADCAPRRTSGDGAVTVSDWVQAGRYVADLDPLTLVQPAAILETHTARAGLQSNSGTRHLTIGNALLAPEEVGSVPVILQAMGDENAIALSLSFNPVAFAYVGATLGSDATDGTLHINATQASAGRLALVLALPAGRSFAPGTLELVRASFRATASASGTFPLSLTDEPVAREIADPTASSLPARYFDGMVAVNVAPELAISRTADKMTLAWPLWANLFVLQESHDGLRPSAEWTNVQLSPLVADAQNYLVIPVGEGNRFYRLARP